MIREMKNGEEDKIRALIAKLNYEDQTFWRKKTKSLEEYTAESRGMLVTEEIKGKNVIFVAEENGVIAGFCWCTIVDRGVDKQGEVAEFYVEREFRGKGIGKELIAAARRLFIDEHVEVAFAWTHHGNKAAIELYKSAGFKEVDQMVMAFVHPTKTRTNTHNCGV
jgi:ribosomal protein S18 acetylase RimI-like enzyme